MVKKILILRHAEKPENYEENDELSAQGFDRAQRLSRLFETQPELLKMPAPVALFAAKYIPGATSKRSLQTLEPMAKKLNLEVRTPYRSRDYQQLAEEILNNAVFDGKSVLIAWTHQYLPKLAGFLGSSPREKWDERVFDRLWILNFTAKGAVSSQEIIQKI